MSTSPPTVMATFVVTLSSLDDWEKSFRTAVFQRLNYRRSKYCRWISGMRLRLWAQQN